MHQETLLYLTGPEIQFETVSPDRGMPPLVEMSCPSLQLQVHVREVYVTERTGPASGDECDRVSSCSS